jgi:hypothetical protein
MPVMLNFVEHDPGSDSERKGPVLVMPPPRSKPSRWHIWRARLFLVEFIFVCLVIGILLIAAPWTLLWTNNSLVAGVPWLHEFMMNDFVRGLVSGLGLIDIWLAISEAIRYREYAE